jgi:hypothetical protein
MLSRRIREHAADLNWVGVAVDLAIVIIGVFLGMQVNDWNQGRLDRRQAREYRAMLVEDLGANLQNLAIRKRYHTWVHAEAMKTLADLGKPPSELNEQFLIEAYQASQALPWSLKRNAYDQLLASGHFGQIGNADLRDKISNYYVGADVTGANLAVMPPYRETLRRAMPYLVQQEIRSHCNETIGEDSRGQAVMGIPGECHLKLDPAMVRAAVRQVHDTPGIMLDLNRQLVDLDQKLLSVDVISRRAARLQQTLQHS